MPPAIQPLEKSAVRAAVKNVKEADYLIAWLEERQDAALFIGNVTKVANGKPRLLVVTKYRVATFGFRQFQTPKFYEFELLQLLLIQCERDEGTWMFDGNTGINVKSSELRQAVRVTLHAHGLISLCLDKRPALSLQLPSSWPSMAVDLVGSCPDMGFSKAWLAHMSYSGGAAGAAAGAAASVAAVASVLGSGAKDPAKEAEHRRRLGAFMENLIGRPVARDRVLDLSYCTELGAADFHAVALTLRDTSMFSGLRVRDLPLHDSVGTLCEHARTSATLAHLTLSGVLPDPSRRASLRLLVEALAAGAAAQLPLTELDLSHNDLREAGVLAVASLVAALPHGLRSLDLSCCHGGARSSVALATALKQRSLHAATMHTLRLASSEMGAKASLAWAEWLRGASALTELDLGSSACSVAALAPALWRGAPGLHALDVSGTRLSRTDLAALLQFCARARSLRRLSVARCALEPEAVCALLQALELNPALEAIELDGAPRHGASSLGLAHPHRTASPPSPRPARPGPHTRRLPRRGPP